MSQKNDLPSLRVELCDIRDPEQMADRVLALCRPDKDSPIPVDDIAYRLDIHEIRRAPISGFEGALLTDRVRSTGSILANDAHGREERVRFTIAHELGHFLLEHHELETDDGFACSSQDMGETSARNQHIRQEAEANIFAISLLAPRARFAALLSKPPDIRAAYALAGDLHISREAALRHLVTLHPEPMAVVFARGGLITAAPRGQQFPWLKGIKGDPLPIDPATLDMEAADWHPAQPGTWCATDSGTILQKIHSGKSGFLTILLWHRE